MIVGIVLSGLLVSLGLGLMITIRHAKTALESRLWISKARFQCESSLEVAPRFLSLIPDIPTTPSSLYSFKEVGFRVPEFTHHSYLFRSGSSLYVVLDWEHTRALFSGELYTESDDIKVRKITRL